MDPGEVSGPELVDLPVEVIRFGLRSTKSLIEQAARASGCDGEVTLRQAGEDPFITDSGNYILDCAFGRIGDPDALGPALSVLPGVVEHGLFLGMASTAIIAGPGGVEVIGRAP